MLSNRQISNFERYLQRVPKSQWGKMPFPVGAYDSRDSDSHGFRRRKMTMDEFARGGEFDFAEKDDGETYGGATKALKFLAVKLSAEDWAAFQRALCGGRDDDSAKDNDPPGFEKLMRDPDAVRNRPAAMDSAKGVRSFAAMFPDATPVRHV